MPELTPEQKTQLDRNIRNMLSQGASEDDVIAYSKDFRAKYDIPVEKKNQVGNVSASGSGVGGLSTSQSPLQSQGVSRDIAGVQQGGLTLNEVSLKPQDENQPSTSRLKIQATDARVGGDQNFNNEQVGSALKSIGKGAALGFGTGIANIPKAIGIAAKELDFFNEYEGKEAKDLATYKAGQWIEETTKDLVGELTPEEQQKFSVKLAQGFGNMATLAVGGIGAKALGASVPLTTAAIGATQGGTSEYENAIASGATPDQASKAFWINAAIGTTDAWPVMGAFRKLDKYTGGVATGALAKKLSTTIGGRLTNDIAQGVFKEAAQEAGQQILTNITALNTYDAARGIFDDVLESAGIGGIIGGTMTGALAAIREKRMAGNLTKEEETQLDKAEKFVEEKIQEATEAEQKQATEQPNQGEEVQGSVATEAQPELPTADQQIKLTEETIQPQPETPSPVPEGGAKELKIKDYEYNDKDKSGGSGMYVDIDWHKEMAGMLEKTGRGKMDFFLGSAIHRREGLKNRNGEFKELSNRQANRVYENILNNVDNSKDKNVGEFRASLNMLVSFLDTMNSEQSKEIASRLKPILKEAEDIEQKTRDRFWEVRKMQDDATDTKDPELRERAREMFDEWVKMEKTFKDFDTFPFRSDDITGKGQQDKLLLPEQKSVPEGGGEVKGEPLPQIEPEKEVVEFYKVGKTKILFDRKNKKFAFETPTGRVSSPKQAKLAASKITPRYFRAWWREMASDEQKAQVETIRDEMLGLLQKAQNYEYADDIETFLMRMIRDVKFHPSILKDLTDVPKSKWTTEDVDNIKKGFNLDTFVQDQLGINKDGLLEQEGFSGYSEAEVMEMIKDIIRQYPNGIRAKDISDRVKEDNPLYELERLEDEFIELTGLDINKALEIYEDEKESLGKRQAEVQAPAKTSQKEIANEQETIPKADKSNQQSNIPPKEESKPSEPTIEAGEGAKTPQPPDNEPPKGEVAVGGEEGGTGITHAQTAETREQFGFEEYEKKPETFEQWDAKADERIAKGDMPALIKKMQEGKTPSEVEQRMMGKYIAELAKKAEENPSDENLNRLHEAIVLSDIIGGRETAKSLVSRKGTFLPDDSLAGLFEAERMNNKDAPLTEAQKETVKKEWEDLQKAKDAYNAYVFEKESELGAREAQAKIAEENQSSPTRKKGTRKTDKDFADERKQIITDIKDKLKKARGETQATILPFAKELIAISPDVAKLVRNLVDNGITKLADIVDRVHEILKEDIEKISKQDVIDLIAGNYNEKKKTRNQLARDLFELRTEAKLINEYDKLQSGIEPKKEKEKVQKNQKLETLRKQIKEHDLTKLSQVKSKLNSEIEKVENQIAKGDFAKPEKKPQIKLDKEGNALRDKLIKLQQQRDARMLLTQRQNEGSKARALRIAAEIFNIPRTLMTIGDFSGLLRQNLFFSVGHPGITAKALPGMFKSFTSQKVYDRWFADLKDTPRYDVIQKSRLAISDSLNHDLSKREEDFMSTLAEKIPVIGRDFNIGKGKIPGLNIVKGSERSYTMLLNKVRVDMFNYFADKMEARGLTVENSPKEYKAMAEYINNATGRSDFGERLNRIAPILNSVFFSPRLIASRVNMLTYWAQPRFWKTLPKEARIDYFRNWGSLLAVGGTIMALAAMAGADVEDDPRSSDFGKIKSGDTRWDIWGGAQPYVRAFAQVATGTRKSTNSGKLYDLDGDDIFGENRMGVVTDFFRNKLAPVPGAAVDVLSGRTSIGDKIVYQWGDAEDKEISIDEYVKQRLLPMTITGTQEAIKQDGWERLFTVGIPSTFGVGTQAYEKSNTKPKTIKLYQPNGTKTREATPEEYAKYEKERDEIFVKKMDEIEKRGHVWLNKYGELTTSKDDKVKTKPLQDLTKEEKKDLSSRIKTQAGNEAKKKIKF